jgi:uncharacterized protein
MLLSFSVSNFRSFNTEQTLNLIASKRFGDNEGSPHCSPVPGTDEHALRIASLYGANGAGKSNLVRALSVIKKMVLTGSSPKQVLPFKPFIFGAETRKEPTSFELRFIEGNSVFCYGICFDDQRILEEWLDIYEGKKEVNLFSRICDSQGSMQVHLADTTGRSTFSHKIKALAEVGARPNQLFLTEIVNIDDPQSQGPIFQDVINWFKNTLNIIDSEVLYGSVEEIMEKDKDFANFAGLFLQEADTGISSLSLHVEDIKDFELPFSMARYIYDKITEQLLPAASHLARDKEIILAEGDNKSPILKVRRITALHKTSNNENAELPIKEESDGSQRLLKLLPVLYNLFIQGGVFIIDELERSMHPMLARKFVEYFLKVAKNKQSQLIFTTHETTLLDLDIMRRDGIWFAEKNKEGESNLYSLADFKARKDLRIDKGYMAGRFGAVPFLGGIDRLMEQEAIPENSGA